MRIQWLLCTNMRWEDWVLFEAIWACLTEGLDHFLCEVEVLVLAVDIG